MSTTTETLGDKNMNLPCGCKTDVNDPKGPIFWNQFNGVVQCHKCGASYAPSAPSPQPKEDEISPEATKAGFEIRDWIHRSLSINRVSDAIIQSLNAREWERIVQSAIDKSRPQPASTEAEKAGFEGVCEICGEDMTDDTPMPPTDGGMIHESCALPPQTDAASEEKYKVPQSLWVKFRTDGTRGIENQWEFEPWGKESENTCGIAHRYDLAPPQEKTQAEGEWRIEETRAGWSLFKGCLLVAGRLTTLEARLILSMLTASREREEKLQRAIAGLAQLLDVHSKDALVMVPSIESAIEDLITDASKKQHGASGMCCQLRLSLLRENKKLVEACAAKDKTLQSARATLGLFIERPNKPYLGSGQALACKTVQRIEEALALQPSTLDAKKTATDEEIAREAADELNNSYHLTELGTKTFRNFAWQVIQRALARHSAAKDGTDSAPYWLCYAMADDNRIKEQSCDSRRRSECSQTDDCITEWCVICAAKAWMNQQEMSAALTKYNP